MKTLFKTALILSVIALAGCSKNESREAPIPFYNETSPLYQQCLFMENGKYDLNGDHVLTQEEAKKIKTLVIDQNNRKIKSFEGINLLTGLEYLEYYYLDGQINTTLSLPNLKTFSCWVANPNNIYQTSEIRFNCPNLEQLTAQGTIRDINISQCPVLKTLYISCSSMQILDISNNKVLNSIEFNIHNFGFFHTLYVWTGFDKEALEKFVIGSEVTIIEK